MAVRARTNTHCADSVSAEVRATRRLFLLLLLFQLLLAACGQTPATTDCDPNYSGACVPVSSDVDCAGGSGDGPEYVQGPVRVIGTDIYDLDRDGDGIGCDR